MTDEQIQQDLDDTPLSNVEVEIFDGAGHGFTWPSGPTYHDVAAKGSWSKTMALFAEHLDTPAH